MDHRKAIIGVIAALVCAADGGPARSADKPPIEGNYLCVSDCRLTDAPPSIEIEGSTALCRSELGGIYTGRLLTDRSVSCFNTTGTLSDDGTQVLWSNGAVWKRR